jgi:hypothetical protein
VDHDLGAVEGALGDDAGHRGAEEDLTAQGLKPGVEGTDGHGSAVDVAHEAMGIADAAGLATRARVDGPELGPVGLVVACHRVLAEHPLGFLRVPAPAGMVVLIVPPMPLVSLNSFTFTAVNLPFWNLVSTVRGPLWPMAVPGKVPETPAAWPKPRAATKSNVAVNAAARKRNP